MSTFSLKSEVSLSILLLMSLNQNNAGLEIATDMIANATNVFSLVENILMHAHLWCGSTQIEYSSQKTAQQVWK